jgi:hypothetical protein
MANSLTLTLYAEVELHLSCSASSAEMRNPRLPHGRVQRKSHCRDLLDVRFLESDLRDGPPIRARARARNVADIDWRLQSIQYEGNGNMKKFLQEIIHFKWSGRRGNVPRFNQLNIA